MKIFHQTIINFLLIFLRMVSTNMISLSFLNVILALQKWNKKNRPKTFSFATQKCNPLVLSKSSLWKWTMSLSFLWMPEKTRYLYGAMECCFGNTLFLQLLPCKNISEILDTHQDRKLWTFAISSVFFSIITRAVE